MTVIRSIALLSTSPHVTQAMLAAWAPVYQTQAMLKAASWVGVYSDLVAPSVRAVAAVSDLVDGDTPMIWTPTINQPGDLAYHYEYSGLPYGIMLADEFQSVASMQQAGDHEIGECIVDPDCDRYDAEDVAIEIHDPTQGLTMVLGGVACSPWVLGPWNGIGTGPTCSNGSALAVHTVDLGGYYQRRDRSEVMAPGYRHSDAKLGYHSRRNKRLRAGL